MNKVLSFTLLFIMQTSFANASGRFLTSNDALILSPKVFVFNEITLTKPLEVLPAILNDTVIASLSWTDDSGDKWAEIEIVNITHNEDKNTVIVETKQWLPYTLSGEVMSLPVVLKNAKLKLLR